MPNLIKHWYQDVDFVEIVCKRMRWGVDRYGSIVEYVVSGRNSRQGPAADRIWAIHEELCREYASWKSGKEQDTI